MLADAVRSARAGAALIALAAVAGLAAAEEAPATPALPRAIRGLDGRPVALEAPRGGALAVVFYSSECPISNAYSPTLKELVAAFPRGRFRLVGLCTDPDLTDAELAAHAKEFGLAFPVARDRDQAVARALGATVTPEAFVLDDAGTVRYRGRIDDQWAARRKRNATARTQELHDAVAAVLDGREVACKQTEPIGCPLPEPPQAAAEAVTFHGRVEAILQKNCQECHRPGQVGPFALMTYEQARKRAEDIATVALDRTMPPWKADPDFGPRFQHDRSLSEADIHALTAWAEAGAPEGTEPPPPPAEFSDDWRLGTPDLVLEMPEPFAVPASGEDIYRCFVIPTDLPEDKYIAAIEYRPGNRRVVHHVLSYVETQGQGRKRDAEDPGPGYACFSGPGVEIHGDLGGWAPGNEAQFLPEGVGRALPRGADVVMQVHYHASGKPETDRTRIGLYFARKPVKQVLHWGFAYNPLMRLPAGKVTTVEAEWTVPKDVEARAVTPHMHLLGREMTVTATLPDGRNRELVRIGDWDFNWQNTYYFEQPIDLPAGTVLKVVGRYDNTDANPRNPNHPPVDVHWGEATTDEMCIGFLAITQAGQDLTRPGATDELREALREDFKKREQENKRKIEEMKKKAKEAKGREEG